MGIGEQIEFILCAGLIFALAELFGKVQSRIGLPKRVIFWKATIIFLISLIAQICIFILGIINPKYALPSILAIIGAYSVYAYWYLKTRYLDVEHMFSNGDGINFPSRYDLQGLFGKMQEGDVVIIQGIRLSLLLKTKDVIESRLECIDDVNVDYQFHDGTETLTVLEGQARFMPDSIIKKDNKIIIHNIQNHCLVAKAGTIIHSKIVNHGVNF